MASAPSTSATSAFHSTRTLGWARTRAAITLEARKLSRRWMTTTSLANLVRYSVSSIAVSPPPTTARRLLRNAGIAPSQTAQADTPPPVWARRSSLGSPIHLAAAPVATITVRAVTGAA